MKRFGFLIAFIVFSLSVLSQESTSDASDAPQVIPSDETLQKQYEKEYKEIVKKQLGVFQSEENPMLQRAQSAYSDYENSSIASQFFESVNDNTKSELNSSGALLFFISSSMPARVIKQYLAQAEPINAHIMFVIKGTIDDDIKMLPTVQYLQDLKSYTGCGESLCQRAVNTVIDSRLFDQYGIQQVPAIAYTREFSSQAYFDRQVLPNKTNPNVVVGEATLPFLIKTLSEEINDETLTAIATEYRF